MSDRSWLKKSIKGICLLVVLVLCSHSGYAEESHGTKQLNVLGSAVIYQKNLADARQNAVNDALVAAVGQITLGMLTNETVVRRFQIINDNILAQKDNYVQNYRVLTETVSGGTIRLLVQVDVATDRLSRDLSHLGLALAGAVHPKVLFMLAEKNVTDTDFSFWWGSNPSPRRGICETAMATELQTAGFDIVNPPAEAGSPGLPMSATNADMLALAKQLGADILISGQVVATIAPNTMGQTTKSFEAVIDAQAFNVKSGASMGKTHQKGVVSAQNVTTGGHEALSRAGTMAGDDLSRQMMTAWLQEQERSTIITVVVEGTGGQIANFVRLRTAITSLSGVKEVKMREMSANQSTMAVNYEGSSRSLADALLLKTFSGFGIDIYDVAPEIIRIRLVQQ
jgi:hypothetical protein